MFARDPGAANCVIPVYRKLTQKDDIEIDLLGKEFALASYEREGVAGRDIMRVLPEFSEASCVEYLRNQRIALVLSSIGSTDGTERVLWASAKTVGIPSVCIMDYWLNYEMRFATPSGPIYPDTICVIDELMKEEMIAKGFPAEKLVITGQPYFETIRQRAKNLSAERTQDVKHELGIADDEYVVLFSSEPILESYTDPLTQWGYTEVTIFEAIMEALVPLAEGRKIVCVTKLHPRNRKDIFESSLRKFPDSISLRVIMEDVRLAQEMISIADMVLGMSSMFLLEASLFPKPFASVQIGLCSENPFPLSRRGVVKTILSKEELVALLQQAIRGNLPAAPAWQVAEDASDHIVTVISKKLNEKSARS